MKERINKNKPKGSSLEHDHKKNALLEWSKAYADENFQQLGRETYAIPPFPIGSHVLKKHGVVQAYGTSQESEVRSDLRKSKLDELLE